MIRTEFCGNIRVAAYELIDTGLVVYTQVFQKDIREEYLKELAEH